MSSAVLTNHRGNPNGNPENLMRGGGERTYDWGEIIRLKKAGRESVEIARLLGCTDTTVYRVLRKSGMAAPKPSFTEEEERFILMLLEDGCPYTEVAVTVGSTRHIIEHRWPGLGLQGGPGETLVYARARRDFERLVKRLGLDEREER